MKKAISAPLLVLFALLVFTLYNYFIMSQNTVHWCHQLQQTVLFVQSEDWYHAEISLEESYADWSKHQIYLHIVSTHDTIHEAESMYQRARAFAAAQEPSELQAELAGLQAQLRSLAAKEQFSIRNIL